ncbi:MAG: winged helix-turn-helix domain-containing protein [Candidatus Asgardarchaeia archaeon]
MRRTKIDIYADILEVIKRYPEGCGITRISYGSGMPNDRTRRFLNQLINHGLVKPRTDDPRKYMITSRGLEFLDAYYKLRQYL